MNFFFKYVLRLLVWIINYIVYHTVQLYTLLLVTVNVFRFYNHKYPTCTSYMIIFLVIITIW